MPADLTKPFRESCCDGGQCSESKMSAQPCGCDPGAKWNCARYPDCTYGKLEKGKDGPRVSDALLP